METKTVPKYEYLGLGFPITLKGVELVNIQGHWHPKINVKNVAYEACRKFIKKASATSPLTGDEIKFIRVSLNMSKQAFGKKFNVAHTTVMRWERAGDKVPKTRKDYSRDILKLETFVPSAT